MDSDDDALLKTQHINTLGQFWVSIAWNTAEAFLTVKKWKNISSRFSLFLCFDYSMRVYAGVPDLSIIIAVVASEVGFFQGASKPLQDQKGFWNTCDFFLNSECESKCFVICRLKRNRQLNGNENMVCDDTVKLFLSSFCIISSVFTPSILPFFFFLSLLCPCLRQQKRSCLGCWSCSMAM